MVGAGNPHSESATFGMDYGEHLSNRHTPDTDSQPQSRPRSAPPSHRPRLGRPTFFAPSPRLEAGREQHRHGAHRRIRLWPLPGPLSALGRRGVLCRLLATTTLAFTTLACHAGSPRRCAPISWLCLPTTLVESGPDMGHTGLALAQGGSEPARSGSSRFQTGPRLVATSLSLVETPHTLAEAAPKRSNPALVWPSAASMWWKRPNAWSNPAGIWSTPLQHGPEQEPNW